MLYIWLSTTGKLSTQSPVTSNPSLARTPPQELLPPALPIISVSKGIEVTTGQLMSEVIPSVLSKKHPTVYLSGEWARWLAGVSAAGWECCGGKGARKPATPAVLLTLVLMPC